MRYECSDEELLYMIRQKDENALDILLKKYDSSMGIMCNELLKRQGRNDYEDARQIARIGFFSAVETYRPDRAASFRYFAKMCAEREVRSMLRKERVKGQYAYHRSVSLNQSINEADGAYLLDFVENPYPEYNPAWNFEYNRLKKTYEKELDKLTEQEKIVFSLWDEGLPYKEIASRLNMKTKAVDNMLQRVRKKLGRVFD